MYGYIYLTTNLINGKKYIGMHKWDKQEIDKSYLGSGVHLNKAIQKYGKENFSCEIIEWCNTREELSEREKYYISVYKAPISEEFYNIEDGGFGGHSEYYSQPITEKMLDALEKGRHLSASDRLKSTLSSYRRSVVVSDSTREMLRKNQFGKRCVNNGVVNKYVPESEMNKYTSLGWVVGRLPRKDSANKRVKITKDSVVKRVRISSVDNYINDGWQLL